MTAAVLRRRIPAGGLRLATAVFGKRGDAVAGSAVVFALATVLRRGTFRGGGASGAGVCGTSDAAAGASAGSALATVLRRTFLPDDRDSGADGCPEPAGAAAVVLGDDFFSFITQGSSRKQQVASSCGGDYGGPNRRATVIWFRCKEACQCGAPGVYFSRAWNGSG